MVNDFRPAVALVALGMPEIDGFAVAQTLRAHYPPTALRLVALSGYGRATDRSRANAVGFDRHLLKPVNQAQLAERAAPPA